MEIFHLLVWWKVFIISLTSLHLEAFSPAAKWSLPSQCIGARCFSKPPLANNSSLLKKRSGLLHRRADGARMRFCAIAPSGWRSSNEVLHYCTVRPLGVLWRLTVGGTPLVSTSDGWSYPATLPFSDDWVLYGPFPPFLNRQAARGAVKADGWGCPLYGWVYPTPFWRLE
jgi:hypothetical protein